MLFYMSYFSEKSEQIVLTGTVFMSLYHTQKILLIIHRQKYYFSNKKIEMHKFFKK